MSWRVLIADDEPLVRGRLKALLAQHPEFELAAECGDGAEALRRLEQGGIQLALLDVQMPELDGFAVLDALGPERPVVIFVTAYDEHALRAFEAHAIDYLLKPFDADRFGMAIGKARHWLQGAPRHTLESALNGLLADLRKQQQLPQRFAIKRNDRILFVRPEEIDWVEASGNYVTLHVNQEAHLLRETLSSIEERLDPKRFVRIHRSTIVNIDRIRELRPWFHGDYQVLLNTGQELMLSRARRPQLELRLGPLP
ncbi:MAG: response regulator transcription factor [Acidobacteria bacterium]|nr:response regulator transcription factor [Acidobacteriota bacterium]